MPSPRALIAKFCETPEMYPDCLFVSEKCIGIPFLQTSHAMFERSRFTIEQIDPEVFAAIQKENQRQEDHIELIASENYTSPAVMAAQGSQLTNKYAEGYPG